MRFGKACILAASAGYVANAQTTTTDPGIAEVLNVFDDDFF